MMGRGMGGGRGRGMGRGMGPFAPGAFDQAGQRHSNVAGALPAGVTEVDALKAEARKLEIQLQAIRARLGNLDVGKTQRPMVAIVDARRCTGCTLCARVCLVNAITVDRIAVIDAARCTGCGDCVGECPRNAIVMEKRPAA